MARLAASVDVEQRTSHVVVADLHCTDALIWHVTVGAGHTGARVDSLVVHLELGMLRLQRGSAAYRVRPVLVPVYFIV